MKKPRPRNCTVHHDGKHMVKPHRDPGLTRPSSNFMAQAETFEGPKFAHDSAVFSDRDPLPLHGVAVDDNKAPKMSTLGATSQSDGHSVGHLGSSIESQNVVYLMLEVAGVSFLIILAFFGVRRWYRSRSRAFRGKTKGKRTGSPEDGASSDSNNVLQMEARQDLAMPKPVYSTTPSLLLMDPIPGSPDFVLHDP